MTVPTQFLTTSIPGRFDAEIEHLDDSNLEEQLCLLAGNINAASYRFVKLIAACDNRRLWAQQGSMSCAYWLNWVCGLSLHAAREKIRVGHALNDLPKISAAYSAGELSFSKVRAMTRVAIPENEDYLLMLARHGTAKHLESLVSAYRSALACAESERAQRQRANRRLEWRIDEDGVFVVTCRLTPEAGSRVIKAIESAIDDLEAEQCEAKSPGNDNPASEQFAPIAITNLDQPGNTYGLSASHGSPVIDVVAMKRADALARLADAYLDGGQARRSPSERYQVLVHVDAQVLSDPSKPGRSDISGPAPIAAALAGESARRIACDSSLVGVIERLDNHGKAILDMGRKSRSIPPPMKRALNARDSGCRFPGCSATRHVEGHHIHHWANGGDTSLDNLVSLCSHHHALVHEGGYSIERTVLGDVTFIRPGGDAVPQVPPHLFSNGSIVCENRVREIPIDHRTGRPRWDGAAMDKSLAVECMLQHTRPDLVWGPGQRRQSRHSLSGAA